jgi:hypothetical protein
MKRISTLLFFFIAVLGANAQYMPVKNASLINAANKHYELTPQAANQRGAVWATNSVSFASSWTITAEMNFGVLNDAIAPPQQKGADGITFVILKDAPDAETIGAVGRGIGYATDPQDAASYPVSPKMSNSFAFEVDTWYNGTSNGGPGDPDVNTVGDQDHVAFLSNGNFAHGVSGPTAPQLIPNVETGNWYSIAINWNSTTSVLTVTFNGVPYVYSGPSVASIIGSGGNNVYWGFTSATGMDVNQHQVRNLAINTPQPPPTDNCSAYTVTASLPKLSCDNGNTIYIGYGTQSVTAVASPAIPASTYKWYRIGTPDVQVATGATFTPTTSGSFYVVATNGTCTASTKGSATNITVIDIRCGKANQHKVNVCHKPNGNGNGINGTINGPNTLCVDESAVAAHLAHGDCLGECPPAARTAAPLGTDPATVSHETELTQSLVAYPNPSRGQVQVNLVPSSTRSEILVINSRGTVVERRTANGSSTMTLDLKKYGAGVYMIKQVSGNVTNTTKVVVND